MAKDPEPNGNNWLLIIIIIIIIIIIDSTVLRGPEPSSEASASFPFPLLRSSKSSLPKS
jgi:hypothetical protein